MKILLIGENSGVHNTLAEGLRGLGHEVVVASNGDFWKKFYSDIDLSRGNKLLFLLKLMKALPKMRGFDVVQLISPIFIDIKAQWHFPLYNYLRKHNGKIVLCAVGLNYYYSYVNRNMKPMKFSDFNIGTKERRSEYRDALYNDWVGSDKDRLNHLIAADCDAIVAGAYEYWLPYSLIDERDKEGRRLSEKLYMVPFPFKLQDEVHPAKSGKIRFFIGISKGEWAKVKGTDIMLRAARDLENKYSDRMELKVVSGVPYAEYCNMMNNSDVMLDQLNAYGPGMNALLTLSKGIVTVSGGEPEHYDIMGEKECRPIITVQPTYESVYNELERLILHPELLPKLKKESRRYVERNYDYRMIAKKYEEIYKKICKQ